MQDPCVMNCIVSKSRILSATYIPSLWQLKSSVVPQHESNSNSSSYCLALQDHMNSALENTPLGPVPVHPVKSAEGQIHYDTQVCGLQGELTDKPHILNEVG